MPSVSKLLTDLHSALETNANERKLLDFIDECLSLLRTIYRERRGEFTDEAIVFLKSLTSVQDSLREFIEAIEEKDWIRTRDDAQELAARFGELKERLTPHFVAKRAEKEFREVVANAQSLPFEIPKVPESNCFVREDEMAEEIDSGTFYIFFDLDICFGSRKDARMNRLLLQLR